MLLLLFRVNLRYLFQCC